MELVNIIYRFINKIIVSSELVILIENIDRSKFDMDEQKELDILLNDIKSIIDKYPTTEDDDDRKRIRILDKTLAKLDNSLNSDFELDDKTRECIEEVYNNTFKNRYTIKDNDERYEKLYSLLVQNKLFEKYMDSLNDKELFEFITKYIFVPISPNLSQEEFDRLVQVGIKEDNREGLWRLAFNYRYKNINFSKIYNYFIEIRDAYYLTELISNVKEVLDIYDITNSVIKTKDKDFILSYNTKINNLNLLEKEELNKIREDNKDLLKELFD